MTQSEYEDGCLKAFIKGKEHAIDLIFKALKKTEVDTLCWCDECFERNKARVLNMADGIEEEEERDYYHAKM